jgi:small subunit ribosomal protein S16
LVKIRLKRMGTTKRPVYRLVVADSRSPRDGRFIESIGFYDPLPNPAVVRIDAERVQIWIKRGARPSDSARQLLVKEGILAARPFKVTPRPEPAAEPATPKAPAASAAPEPAAAVAVAEETAEATVADAPAETAAAAAEPADTAVAEEPAEPVAIADDPETESTTKGDASASPADEPANDEESAEAVTAAAASAPHEAGGDAGGSPDAPQARRGGVPAATGPAAADDAGEDATE